MKELSQFEMQLLEKMFTGNKEGLRIDKYLESENFKKSIISLLDFEKINGKDCLTLESKNKIKEIDPIDLLERFVGEKNNVSIGGTIMVSMVRKMLINIIAENTYDISNTYNVDYQDYLNLFKSYGFENILEIRYNKKIEDFFSNEEEVKDYVTNTNGKILSQKEENGKIYLEYEREEIEFFLFNKERGLLIHGETIGKNVNSVDLIANVEVKENMELRGYSGGIVHGTNKKNITIDLRELPSSILDDVYLKTNPVKDFLEFDYMFYSYLSHKEVEVGDVSWKEIQAQKISQFPKEVIEQLVSKNISGQLLKNVNSYLTEDKKVKEKNGEEKNFMFELDDSFINEINFRSKTLYGNSKLSYLSEDLTNLIIEKGLEPKICADYCSYSLKRQKGNFWNYENCIQMLSTFNKEELVQSKKNASYLLINREDNKNLLNYIEARIEFFNQPSSNQTKKRKLN